MEKNLETMRHSCSHLLAAAVMELWPKTKLGIGPAIEKGFYYDFDPSTNSGQVFQITEANLPKIEAKMAEIKKESLPFIREEVSPGQAEKQFKDQPYKLELIADLAKEGTEKVCTYRLGDFLDLCLGPHVDNTSEIGSFKLLSIAGAYWKGSEKNKMLTRIYGTCSASEKELTDYLNLQEEIKKRDHRKLGVEQKLWVFSPLVGAGLPLFTQRGALVRQLIIEFVEKLQSKQGIAQVWTPQIAKAELFKISGHYAKYQGNMFKVFSNYSDEEFFLKPMNCPQHTQIYASEPRSYRDLPIRMSDFAMLYRDEKPGELIGLARTRGFSQDDCHVFCREDQVIAEMNLALDMTKEIMEAYGFKYRYRLSVKDPEHPEKYVGDPKTWEKAEALAKQVLEQREIDYYIGIGEAAFYGPKLDLIVTDSLGREWQLSTLQIDFFMPERFDLTYVDKNGQFVRPVMLHRAIVGSPERLMMVLLEHYAGALPVWLSPVQVKVIPISEKSRDYAEKTRQELFDQKIRVELDERDERMQAKIRDAEREKVPYMLIVGPKEAESKNVSVRVRGERDLGSMKFEEFLAKIKEDIAKKRQV